VSAHCVIHICIVNDTVYWLHCVVCIWHVAAQMLHFAVRHCSNISKNRLTQLADSDKQSDNDTLVTLMDEWWLMGRILCVILILTPFNIEKYMENCVTLKVTLSMFVWIWPIYDVSAIGTLLYAQLQTNMQIKQKINAVVVVVVVVVVAAVNGQVCCVAGNCCRSYRCSWQCVADSILHQWNRRTDSMVWLQWLYARAIRHCHQRQRILRLWFQGIAMLAAAVDQWIIKVMIGSIIVSLFQDKFFCALTLSYSIIIWSLNFLHSCLSAFLSVMKQGCALCIPIYLTVIFRSLCKNVFNYSVSFLTNCSVISSLRCLTLLL